MEANQVPSSDSINYEVEENIYESIIADYKLEIEIIQRTVNTRKNKLRDYEEETAKQNATLRKCSEKLDALLRFHAIVLNYTGETASLESKSVLSTIDRVRVVKEILTCELKHRDRVIRETQHSIANDNSIIDLKTKILAAFQQEYSARNRTAIQDHESLSNAVHCYISPVVLPLL